VRNRSAEEHPCTFTKGDAGVIGLVFSCSTSLVEHIYILEDVLHWQICDEMWR